MRIEIEDKTIWRFLYMCLVTRYKPVEWCHKQNRKAQPTPELVSALNEWLAQQIEKERLNNVHMQKSNEGVTSGKNA